MRLFKSKKKLEAQLRQEVEEGRYFRAIQYYMEQGRFADAAEVHGRKGEFEKAASLYERAGELEKAGHMYARAGDDAMAALLFRDAGNPARAAAAFTRDGRHDAAAEMLERAGDWVNAAAQWRLAGEPERAAAALETSGNTQEASALKAEMAEKTGHLASAAALWERAGHPERAFALYRQLDDAHSCARIAEATGDLRTAAKMRARAGDFLEAGRLYESLNKPRKAAFAYGRAGDVHRAVELLTEVQDWYTIARTYVSHKRSDEARRVLRMLRPDSPDFDNGLAMLAPLEEAAGENEAAFRAYDALVRHDVDRGRVGSATRQHVLRQVNILWNQGLYSESLGRLARLSALGIMTPELQARLDQLRKKLAAAKSAPEKMGQLGGSLIGVSSERYEFRRQIAQGGNGIIYLAFDRMLNRELVIKMIRETALPGELAADLFLREAKTSAKLNHPNIVTVYDLGSIDGQPYIAMEFVKGETLVDYAERTELPMKPATLVDIYVPLCRALQYAHDKGFVHRDIKLENVMLTPERGVKLMDFGLAQAMRTSEGQEMITGTPLYMPPEQIVGSDIDHRADVYALGIMLFVLAAGQWPYDRGNVLHHHRFTPVPDPREHNPALPPNFKTITDRCLAKDREERYDSVSDLSNALRQCFNR